MQGSEALKYQIMNGTSFNINTPEVVCNILEEYRMKRVRIRIFYGDASTGRDWNEEHDIQGYIGRSSGSIKIPLLINNSRSSGGSAILDHCIIRITVNRQDVYKHPRYNSGDFTIINTSEREVLKASVLKEWKTHATNCESTGKAQKYVDFLEGKRNKY